MNYAKIALLVAFIGLGISIVTLVYAVDQIKTSNDILEQTQISSKNIENLAIKSSKQLELLSEVLLETEQQTLNQELQILKEELQTLTDVYQQGSPFHVLVDSCSFLDDKIILELEVFDKIDLPSTIKFEIIIDFVAYTVGGNVGNEDYVLANPQQLIFEPGSEKKTEFQLDEIFNILNETEDSELYLSSKYKFAPYFDKEGSTISHYIIDYFGHLLLGFEKDVSSGEWIQITGNPNIVCK